MTRVDITDRAPASAAWDQLVQASDGSLFYRADVLRAYERHPLGDTLASFYLSVRSETDARLDAVLPAFLLKADDTIGLLSKLMPRFQAGGRPLLLSHIWYWYDTHLPARRLDLALTTQVCTALRDLAAECGAQAFGFVNVSDGGLLADLLRGTGLAVQPVDARYVLDLTGFRSVDGYLAGLRPSARHDIRRHVRRARDAGATVTVGPPGTADLEIVARLCQATAAKHGNPGWYRPDRLSSFVMALRPLTRLVSIRLAGRPVAGSISFVDGPRFHNWAAGTVPLSQLPFSPYLVLMEATIRTALAEGCAVLEGGRRNDSWKERLGFRRQPLVGCLSSA